MNSLSLLKTKLCSWVSFSVKLWIVILCFIASMFKQGCSVSNKRVLGGWNELKLHFAMVWEASIFLQLFWHPLLLGLYKADIFLSWHSTDLFHVAYSILKRSCVSQQNEVSFRADYTVLVYGTPEGMDQVPPPAPRPLTSV